MEIETFNKHRLASNPVEAQMYETATKWKKQNSIVFSQAVLGVNSNGCPKDYLTNREERIVFGTLQWLGSPVGQGFLEECGFVFKEIPPKPILDYSDGLK